MGDLKFLFIQICRGLIEQTPNILLVSFVVCHSADFGPTMTSFPPSPTRCGTGPWHSVSKGELGIEMTHAWLYVSWMKTFRTCGCWNFWVGVGLDVVMGDIWKMYWYWYGILEYDLLWNLGLQDRCFCLGGLKIRDDFCFAFRTSEIIR